MGMKKQKTTQNRQSRTQKINNQMLTLFVKHRSPLSSKHLLPLKSWDHQWLYIALWNWACTLFFYIFRYAEAEHVLAGNILTKQMTMENIEKQFGTLASHVFNILGAIYCRTERTQKAIECYKKSLKLNPLLWSSFEGLSQLGKCVSLCMLWFYVNWTKYGNIFQANWF